jgi:LEA14-like dessication related protein
MTRKIWIIPILWCLAFCLTSCQTLEQFIQKPTVNFERMDLGDMSLLDGTLNFYFKVHNPNAFSATLDRLTYQLAIDEKPFADGIVDQKIRIGANAEETVLLPVRVNFLDLFNSIAELAKKEAVAYDLTGAFTVMGVNIPYRADGRVPIPKLPDISLQQVMVSDISLSGASLVFRLALENPNPFAIALDGLEYDVSLAKTSFATGVAKTATPIAANGKIDLDVEMEVKFLRMGQAAHRLISDKSTPYEINGVMVFNAPGAGEQRMPFSRAGAVPMLHGP